MDPQRLSQTMDFGGKNSQSLDSLLLCVHGNEPNAFTLISSILVSQGQLAFQVVLDYRKRIIYTKMASYAL